MLNNKEIKLAQFADDMNLFLKFERETLMQLEYELDTFEEASGLKVNYDKTNIYRLGSLMNTNAKIYTRKPFKWTNDPIKILGIVVDARYDHMNKINFTELTAKVQANCRLWSHRGLSLMGRTLVINTLCASLYVYKSSVLGRISKAQLKDFYGIIRNFLWKGGKSKIALRKLQNSKEFGGLQLIDLGAKDCALKCQWVSDIKEYENIKALSEQFLPKIKQDIWLCNLASRDVSMVMQKSSFWRDVLYSWSTINHKIPNNVTEIATQSLWFNSFVKVNNKLVYHERAHSQGMMFLYNIWNKENQTFFTHNQIQQIYGINVISFLDYYGLVSAIPGNWVRELKKARYIMEDYEFLYESFSGKTTKQTYEKIITDKNQFLDIVCKWNHKLDKHITREELSECFLNIPKLVMDVKMRNFQFRFLHRAIFCAKILHKWKIVDSPRCFYCGDEYETIDHLFYYCHVTRRFWELFQSWYESVTNTEITLTKDLIFLSNDPVTPLINTLLIIAKQFIFSRRIAERELNVYVLKDKIMEYVKIERSHALRTKRYKPFVRKWKDLF